MKVTTEEAQQLSRVLFSARELISMFRDVVEAKTGKKDDWATRTIEEIDAIREGQGWSNDGYGQEKGSQPPIDTVTRFETIMDGERLVVKYGIKAELSFQDDDRTLKVFLSDRGKEAIDVR